MTNIITYTKFLTALFLAAFLAFACDNPVDDGDEHHEAEGFVLTSSGVEIVRYEAGEFAFNETSEYTHDGHLRVLEGQETPLIRINFLESDGTEFTPDDDDLSLDWDITDASIVEIEQHSEDGKWNFHIRGIEEGETSIRFFLMHGDHADFESLPMPVEVEHSDEAGDNGDHDHDH
ncbi:MAG: hypothetical protein WD037_09090 [Balneolales bacterium]